MTSAAWRYALAKPTIDCMTGRLLLWFVLVASLVFWLGTAGAAGVRAQEITLTVQVKNSAQVPEKVLREATRLAAGIFRHSGVTVIWDTGPAGIRIHLLPAKPSADLHGDAAGFSILEPDRTFVGVFYPVVLSAATELEADVDGILGATLAHEIGHVLLGSAHSPAGIMKAHLGATEVRMAERGELLFTSEQAPRILVEARRFSRSGER
jgi:hypothetical protein